MHSLLAATTSPTDPGAVVVGRPSDLLVARLTAQNVSAVTQAVAVQVPVLPVGLGLAGSLVVGLVAGLYPALRAAHLAPAAALRIAG